MARHSFENVAAVQPAHVLPPVDRLFRRELYQMIFLLTRHKDIRDPARFDTAFLIGAGFTAMSLFPANAETGKRGEMNAGTFSDHS
jgi:hypothetical protein